MRSSSSATLKSGSSRWWRPSESHSGEVYRLLLRERGEVRKCVATTCALWPFRMGTNPFRKKRKLSAGERRERAERLIKPGREAR